MNNDDNVLIRLYIGYNYIERLIKDKLNILQELILKNIENIRPILGY